MALINKKNKKEEKVKISPNLLKILQSVLDDHLAGKNAMQRFTNKLKTYLDKKVDKKELVKSVYGVDATGQQHQFSFDSEATGSTIMWRGTDGRSRVEEPLADKDIANKKYVDEHSGKPEKFLATIVKDEETGVATITDESGNETEVGGGGGGVSKEYVDEQDSKTLQEANSYTDDNLSNKVDKLPSGQNTRVYGRNSSGSEVGIPYSATSGSSGTLALFDTNGNLRTGTPTLDSQAANKKYADEQDASTLQEAETYADEVNSPIILTTNSGIIPSIDDTFIKANGSLSDSDIEKLTLRTYLPVEIRSTGSLPINSYVFTAPSVGWSGTPLKVDKLFYNKFYADINEDLSIYRYFYWTLTLNFNTKKWEYKALRMYPPLERD